MDILDIMESVSLKGAPEDGLSWRRIPGVIEGIVAENYDKDAPGTVRVRIPVQDEEENILRRAKVGAPYGGKTWGFQFTPEKDDRVLLAFERGNIEKPYVIASIPRETDTLSKETADEDNQTKRIVSRNGNSVTFFDSRDGSEKDRIRLATSGGSLEIAMDNEKQEITVRDKEGNCTVTLNMKDKAVHVEASEQITLKAGAHASVKLDGKTGTVTLEADAVKIKGANTAEMSGGSLMKLSAQQVSAEASAMMKVSSGGMTTVAGSPVKLG